MVITAGLTKENGLRQKMLDAARPHLLRIIGPNAIGLMLPPLKLNAGFFHMPAASGDIALLSQSGAIAASLERSATAAAGADPRLERTTPQDRRHSHRPRRGAPGFKPAAVVRDPGPVAWGILAPVDVRLLHSLAPAGGVRWNRIRLHPATA